MDNNFGMLHIYHGDGKGKTTAAMGLALRAAGYNMHVVITQFLKDGNSGELTAFKSFPNVTVISGKPIKGFTFAMSEEQKDVLAMNQNEHLLRSTKLCADGKCDLLILDEVLDAINEKLIDKGLLLEFLKTAHGHTEIVLTGRNPEKEFLELADYITHVKKVKHPFDSGLSARKGIEL